MLFSKAFIAEVFLNNKSNNFYSVLNRQTSEVSSAYFLHNLILPRTAINSGCSTQFINQRTVFL